MLPAIFTPHLIFILYLTNHNIKKFSGTLLWSRVFHALVPSLSEHWMHPPVM